MLWLTFVYSTKVSGYCNFHTVFDGASSNRLEISTAIFLGPVYLTPQLFFSLLYLRLSWLYQHHPPGPCLCGLLTLSGRAKTITIWSEILWRLSDSLAFSSARHSWILPKPCRDLFIENFCHGRGRLFRIFRTRGTVTWIWQCTSPPPTNMRKLLSSSHHGIEKKDPGSIFFILLLTTPISTSNRNSESDEVLGLLYTVPYRAYTTVDFQVLIMQLVLRVKV